MLFLLYIITMDMTQQKYSMVYPGVCDLYNCKVVKAFYIKIYKKNNIKSSLLNKHSHCVWLRNWKITALIIRIMQHLQRYRITVIE